MIRLGIFSRSDSVLRALEHAARDLSDVSVELLLRSERQLAGPGTLDVLLIDAERPVDAVLLIERVAPLPVVILADVNAARELARLRRSVDGWGMLPRGDGLSPDDPDRLLAAVRAAARGLFVSDHNPDDDSAAEPDAFETRSSPEPGGPPVADGPPGARGSLEPAARLDLTARELEVLALLARGRSNREIADSLGVSSNTVKYHLSGVFSKLDVGTRSEATFEAIRRGLVAI